jgi:hypothetical protein
VIHRFGTFGDGQIGGALYYFEGLLWPWQLFWLPPPAELSTALSAFPWSWLLPVAAAFGILSPRAGTARASGYLLCCLIGFLATISAADVKSPWYAAPAYPLIAVLTALGINEFGRKVRDKRTERLHWAGRAALPAGITLGVACVIANLAKTERGLSAAHYSADRQLHYFLQSLASDHPAYSQVRIVRMTDDQVPALLDGKIAGSEPYDGPAEFYALKLRRVIPDVQLVSFGYAAGAGDVVIGCGDAVRARYRTLAVLKTEGRCFALGNPAPDAAEAQRQPSALHNN